VHREIYLWSGPFVRPKAKVTPARISPTVWPLTRAPRNPKSTAILSCTCQIAPTRAEPIEIGLHRSHKRFRRPVARASHAILDDAVEKVIGMLLAGKLNLRVEMDGPPVPALRDNAVDRAARVSLSTQARAAGTWRSVPIRRQAISSIEQTFSTGRQVSTAFKMRS